MLMLCWGDLLIESSYYILKEPDNCKDTKVMRRRSGEDKGRTASLVAALWEDISEW